jgi:hypothetical protein
MYGKEIMELLLDRRRGGIQIGAEVLQAAVDNVYDGGAIIQLFIDEGGEGMQVTAEVSTKMLKSVETVQRPVSLIHHNFEVTSSSLLLLTSAIKFIYS